jgi:hypothetical protein
VDQTGTRQGTKGGYVSEGFYLIHNSAICARGELKHIVDMVKGLKLLAKFKKEYEGNNREY